MTDWVEEIVRIEYRILSKAPTERTFKYRPQVGATSADPIQLAKTLERWRRHDPAWKFKVEERLVRINHGPWIASSPSRFTGVQS